MVTDVLLAPWAAPAPPPYSGRLFTAADLAALPEDGWLYELVAGHLVRMPLSFPTYAGIVGRAAYRAAQQLHLEVTERVRPAED